MSKLKFGFFVNVVLIVMFKLFKLINLFVFVLMSDEFVCLKVVVSLIFLNWWIVWIKLWFIWLLVLMILIFNVIFVFFYCFESVSKWLNFIEIL